MLLVCQTWGKHTHTRHTVKSRGIYVAYSQYYGISNGSFYMYRQFVAFLRSPSFYIFSSNIMKIYALHDVQNVYERKKIKPVGCHLLELRVIVIVV